MTWLITAYEPFGGAHSNSSLIALSELDKNFPTRWENQVQFFYPVPVTFDEAWSSVLEKAKAIPDLKGIVCMGQAEPRTKITPEKIALNWIDARIPDNKGFQPKNQKVEDGPKDLLWSNIPWHLMSPNEHIQGSYFAGTYLCNSLMYNTLSWCIKNKKFGGFIHFPLLESQNDQSLQKLLPRMKVEDAVNSLSLIIDFLITLDQPLEEVRPFHQQGQASTD